MSNEFFLDTAGVVPVPLRIISANASPFARIKLRCLTEDIEI